MKVAPVRAISVARAILSMLKVYNRTQNECMSTPKAMDGDDECRIVKEAGS